MIVRAQESAQEPSGSWRPCSLPRSHPGHRQEYVRTHGPWIAVSGSSWWWEAVGEIPPFPVVRSDGRAIHRAECCLVIFPLPWLVTVGTGAGAAARSLRSRPDRVCHGPCSWAGYSPRSCTRRRTPGLVCPVPPVRVSDTRSTPLNQENSINGYQQQFKTRSGTQDRNSQGDRLGKRGRVSPGTTSPFRGSTATASSGRPRRASVSSTCSPLPSSPTKRTRSSPGARPRRPRRLAITNPAKRRTFRRRVKSRRLFSWTPVPTKGRHALSETITAQDPSADSAMGWVRKGGTAQSEAGFFARST